LDVKRLKLVGLVVDIGVVRFRLLVILVASPLVLLPTSVADARSSKTLDIKVLSVVRTYAQNDVEPKGLSSGDRITSTDRLYNLVPQFGKPTGALIGSDSGTFTVRTRKAATFGGIARLPGGTIMVRGRLVLGSARSTLAVVGGTGRFSRARGTVSVTTVNASKGLARNVFRLTLP
jgi:Dirigent-like protein